MKAMLSDFTSKHGFDDGERTEQRDFDARDEFVKRFNRTSRDYVAVGWDRGGVHNCCIIMFFEREDSGKKVEPENYLALWRAGGIVPADPDLVRHTNHTAKLLEESYRALDAKSSSALED